MHDEAETTDTIAAWWSALAARRSGEIVLIDNGREITCAEIDALSHRIARGLMARGAGKANRIAILFPNRMEWLAAFIAVSRVGGIAVTLSTFFAPPELAYALAHADVSHLLCAREYLGHRYDRRLEDALPGLADCDGTRPLAIEQCPHLRHIWFDAPIDAGWSAGSFDDLAHCAADTGPGSPAMLAAAQEAISPADPALIMYTSGSTAAPKGVVHLQGTVTAKILYMAEINAIIPNEIEAGDRTLINMPLFWVGGFLSVLSGMELGAVILFEDDHSPATMLRIVREQGATHVSGSEAVLLSITDVPGFRPGDLAGLKAQCTPQLDFIRRYGRPGPDRRANSLGMTETLGPHSGDPDFRLPGEKGEDNFGFALEGMEYRILDPETGARLPPGEKGELAVRGRWLMDGFYKRRRAEIFDADGFYRTGDRCALSEEGVLTFHGRLGGMIKTSGANVSPEEVERALMEHPDIIDVAVFGIPDPRREQAIVAVIVQREGAGLDAQAVRTWLKPRISAFKIPRRVLFRGFDDLPRTPSNKIRKPLLARQLASELDAANGEDAAAKKGTT